MGKPKLAFILNKFPPLGGYRNRLLSQLRLFSQSFDVHMIVLSGARGLPDFSEYVCESFHIYPPRPGQLRRWADLLGAFIQDGRPPFHGHYPLAEQRKRVGQYIKNRGISLIWAFGSLAGAIVKNTPAKFKFIDFGDSNYLSSSTAGRSWFVKESNKNFEKRLAKHFDGFAYISRRDGAALGYSDSEFTVLPNLLFLSAGKNPAPSCDIVVLGNWEYHPNKDGLFYVLDEILPLLRKGVRVNVVGPGIAGAPPSRGHKIKYLGLVDEVLPHIRASKLMLAPIRLGSGAQQKVFDGLEAGIPVLATPFVCKGADPDRSCPAIIECSSPADFVREISHLLEDEPERGRLGLEGRKWLESMAADSLSAHQELVARMVAASSGSPRRLSR
jgi:glycosyltransferase involved in cell wall biosynthesis